VEFEIACTCGQNMLVESRYVGQDVQCPGCGGILRVPPIPRSGDPVPVVWPRSETGPPPPTVPPPFERDDGPMPPTGRRTHPKAIASLVCGILGVVTCPVGPVVLGVISLVLGGQAKRDILMYPDVYDGVGLAAAGQLLGAVGLLLSLGTCLLSGCWSIFRFH